MHYCNNCQTPLSDDDIFCTNCGADTRINGYATTVASQPMDMQPMPGYEAQPVAPMPAPVAPALAVTPKKKSKGPLIAIICVAAVLLIGVIIGAVIFLGSGSGSTGEGISARASEGGESSGPKAPSVQFKSAEIPEVTYTYLSYKPTVKVSYTYEDSIYPRQYNRLDSIAVVTMYGVHGDSDVRVTAEIPGFTQSYSKTLTVGREHTELFIKPSLITGDLGLKSAKNSQLNLKVENVSTGEVLLEETLAVKLFSENDINNYDPQWGQSSCDAYLAFLTPEDDAMDAVSRNAIPIMTELSGGKISSYAGYQYDSPEATLYQVLSTQIAISQMGVRYDAGAYSNSDSGLALQSVKLPREVLEKKSGLCVETSLLLSSVLMNEGMHCFLLFPPGHCQVAVETNNGSGEYYLVETTILPITDSNVGNVVTFLNAEDMEAYIMTGYERPVYVVDCNLVDDLDFQYVNN